MWIHTAEDIAQLVRDHRKRLGLSQLALARKAGVSRQWLVELERGKPTAEVSLVLKTLAAVGLQVDVRDPAQRPGTVDTAAVIEAGRQVLERHRPIGAELRILITRPRRAPRLPPASEETSRRGKPRKPDPEP